MRSELPQVPRMLDPVKLLEQDPANAVVHWIDKARDWFETVCGVNFSRHGYRHKRYQAVTKPTATCVACIAVASRGR